jgi:hypothetical protein
MEGGSAPTHRQRQTAWELYRAQAQRVDDRSVLLDRREQNFSDETHGGAPVITDQLAQAAAKAEQVYKEFGSTAPSPLTGEDARSYRLRVVDELKKHSSRHGNLRLRTLADLNEDAFSAIEGEVLTAALEAGRSFAPPNTLRPREIQRADGSRAIEWAGSPTVWLSHFMAPARAVTRMRIRGTYVVPNRSFIGKID